MRHGTTVAGFALALGVASAAPAQQFDNFGGAGSGGFDLSVDPSSDVEPLTEPDADPDAAPGEDGMTPLRTPPDIALTPGTNPEDDILLRTFPSEGSAITSVSQPATELGTQVTLRTLDKTLGRPTDVTLEIGDTALVGRITITAVECRYPAEDPNSDAFANLAILDVQGNALFGGWMVASSPALNALEHPRYDVWVLSCDAPAG